jgi:type IV secretion system protein TrbL
MRDLSVIDDFMTAFTTYIDAGFGLIGPDVRFLTGVLIGLDVTLAALFWSLEGSDHVLGRLVRKILFVGAFVYILSNFSRLATIIFTSFARAGLRAGGGNLSPEDLLRPGKVASTGFTAAWALLDQASKLLGFTSFFDNFLTIAILLFAWVIVIVAFFILAVQMFVTIVEFRLVSLAGFILVPFALWNRTSFLAERVLGHVVSSGIKVMVLAVIIGIGSGFFSDFAAALKGHEPDIGEAMSLVLASLTLLGLGIFAPSVASGLAAGAPQLGAGSAVATSIGAAGLAYAGAAGSLAAARGIAAGGLSAIRAGTAMGSAAATAYGLGEAAAEEEGLAAGLGGMARAAGNASRARLASTLGLDEAAESGRAMATRAMGGSDGSLPVAGNETPPWVERMRIEQARHQQIQAVSHALEQGEGGGSGVNPHLDERDE